MQHQLAAETDAEPIVLNIRIYYNYFVYLLIAL